MDPRLLHAAATGSPTGQKTMRSSKEFSIILVGIVLSAPRLVCQTSSGSIAGGVRDAQDAAVPNAAVILIEEQRKDLPS